jgi:hypothetical protein
MVMKFTRALPASILMASVMLSASACAPAKEKTPEPSTTPTIEQSFTPVASPDTQTPAPSASDTSNIDEVAAAASTINGYYSYIANPENMSKIQDAGIPLNGHGATATAEELNTLAEALPDGFRYFDTSSPDLIKNAYAQLFVGSKIMNRAAMTVSVPKDAVVISGDEATISSDKTEITVNGKTGPVPSIMGMQDLKLKKVDSGNWLIVADNSIEKAAAAARK